MVLCHAVVSLLHLSTLFVLLSVFCQQSMASERHCWWHPLFDKLPAVTFSDRTLCDILPQYSNSRGVGSLSDDCQTHLGHIWATSGPLPTSIWTDLDIDPLLFLNLSPLTGNWLFFLFFFLPPISLMFDTRRPVSLHLTELGWSLCVCVWCHVYLPFVTSVQHQHQTAALSAFTSAVEDTLILGWLSIALFSLLIILGSPRNPLNITSVASAPHCYSLAFWALLFAPTGVWPDFQRRPSIFQKPSHSHVFFYKGCQHGENVVDD